MKEIKFDIILWDGENPETIEHYTLEEAFKEGFIELHPLKGIDESVIVREFTGIKDKSGKEVYNGDIIKLNKSIYEISYHNLAWRLEYNGFTTFWLKDIYDLGELKNIQVIGNIHENKDLL